MQIIPSRVWAVFSGFSDNDAHVVILTTNANAPTESNAVIPPAFPVLLLVNNLPIFDYVGDSRKRNGLVSAYAVHDGISRTFSGQSYVAKTQPGYSVPETCKEIRDLIAQSPSRLGGKLIPTQFRQHASRGQAVTVFSQNIYQAAVDGGPCLRYTVYSGRPFAG